MNNEFSHPQTLSCGEKINLNDLPDYLRENLNQLCKKIMFTAMMEGDQIIDANLAVGALQLALARSIVMIYKRDACIDVVKSISDSMIQTIQDWQKENP